MTKLNQGDLLIEKDGSHAVLMRSVDSLGVRAWRVYWNNSMEDLFPWLETSIQEQIYKGNLKYIKGGY
tara:strand:- start:4204 stop:4407 length:204 start_codon:yes stop_codon:yes gene_type:complete